MLLLLATPHTCQHTHAFSCRKIKKHAFPTECLTHSDHTLPHTCPTHMLTCHVLYLSDKTTMLTSCTHNKTSTHYKAILTLSLYNLINIFIMKSYLSKQVINGVYKLVQYVTYSNGTQVKRILGKDGIPESVEYIKKGK